LSWKHQLAFSALPAVNGSTKPVVPDNEGRQKSSHIRQVSKIFRKVVDGCAEKNLAGNLSLIGKLFEIYFVRLIGTPNQNSKNDFGFTAEITIVVQNH
jgi:hypothetical protein